VAGERSVEPGAITTRDATGSSILSAVTEVFTLHEAV
jgi:hypothetical protein